MKLSKILSGFLVFFWTSVYAQTQDSLILYYHTYPQEAIQKADSLYREAIKNGNTLLQLKSFILKSTFTTVKQPDLLPDLIQQGENYLSEENDPVSKALLHSYCAQLYLQYYQSHKYEIHQRSNIANYIPEKIESWSENIFTDTIRSHLQASCLPADHLQQAELSSFQEILTPLSAADSLHPTLYDFICYRAIQILSEIHTFYKEYSVSASLYAPATTFTTTPLPADLPKETIEILQIWQNLLRYRLSTPNRPALLQTELDRLKFVQKLSVSTTQDSLFLHALQHLKQEYQNTPFVIEVIAQEAQAEKQILSRMSYQTPENRAALLAQKEKIVHLCETGIALYPNYKRINLLHSLIQDMRSPNLSLQFPAVIFPGDSISIKLSYQNVDNATLQIEQMDSDLAIYDYLKIPYSVQSSHPIYHENYALQPSLIKQDTLIQLIFPQTGLYRILLYNRDSKDSLSETLIVTRLFSQDYNYARQHFFTVCDWKNGRPIADAQIRIYKRTHPGYKLLDTLSTDAHGMAFLNEKESTSSFFYQVIHPDSPNNPFINSYSKNDVPLLSQQTTALITDRKVYRPGQTVYYKGYCWQATIDTLCPLKKKKYQVHFKDPNNREIANQEVYSNSFGTFSGSFEIPSESLNGQFTLTTSYGRTSIEIASYKRPEFEIQFKEIPKYHAGDIVRLTGQVVSYSGVKIAHAKIQFEVSKVPFIRSFNQQASIQGVTYSDTDGHFEITFQSDSLYPEHQFSYLYQVHIQITDKKGENQEHQTFVPVYSQDFSIELQIPQQVNKLQRTAFHLSFWPELSDSLPRSIHYTIYKLVTPKQLQSNHILKDTLLEKIVLQGELSCVSRDSIFPDLSQCPSGIYLFSAQSKQKKKEQIFYLYSPQDHCPPYPTYCWIIKEKTRCRPGESARILFGTSVQNAYVRYDIYNSDRLIKRVYTILSNKIIPIEIPYQTDFGDQICVHVSYVKDQNFISEFIPIERIKDDQKLIIEMQTFRNHLSPNQSENWKIRVTDTQKHPVKAELLAMMYDASLDQIAPYEPDIFPNTVQSSNPLIWYPYYDYQQQKWIQLSKIFFHQPHYPIPALDFCQLETYTFPYKERVMYSVATAQDQVFAQENGRKSAGGIAPKVANFPSTTDLSSFSYRKNFQETAFFYPQLQTDTNGFAEIGFTIPEATTQWKFIVLATTSQLQKGRLCQHIITSKSLLVRPQLPRFLRAGDETEIRITVSNLSTDFQEGKLNFELFIPEKEAIVFREEQKVQIEAQESKTYCFRFIVPDDKPVLACRMVARTDLHSDGEQHLLPVLPKERLVTYSTPIFSHQSGYHSYSLEKFDTSKANKRLTLELSANPLWYAVMAIPPLQNPQQENSTTLSAAYYVNRILQGLIQANPQLSEVIRKWAFTSSDSTFLSRLEQNQELKSILLDATPWVLEAQSEKEQIQTLRKLFDINRLNYLQQTILQKLEALQTPNGAWSWFEGMPSSQYLTEEILILMAKAQEKSLYPADPREQTMQQKALRYLDQIVQQDFQKNIPQHIQYHSIRYLYIRSFHQDIPLGDARQAHQHFMSLLKEQWFQFSLYEKALAAVTLHRYGFQDEAIAILKSLRQYAINDPEQGMYWSKRQFSNDKHSEIQTHVALMDAFSEVEGNSSDIEQMQLWLLRQKQTQSWGNTPSTVDAIHALLINKENQLNSPEPLKIQLGKQTFTLPTETSPLGYLKKSYEGDEIRANMQTVRITQTNNAPIWGGLYLQRMEKLQQITDQKGEITIRKQLFVEKTNAKGENKLHPIEQENLKVGDKIIIRLTLNLQRDMDFLHLQDSRAACFEPLHSLSGNQWKFGTVYYQETKDAVTNFFFNSLSKGTYVLEYPVWIQQQGIYQDGIATFQSIYTPECIANSKAIRIEIK